MARIDDLLLAPDGWVNQVILSVGDFVDVEDKLVAIPLTGLEISYLGVYYDVGAEELEQMPEFQYKD